ncbi:MAG: hypothetical protein OXH95_06120 [bacterium]|nr:hypothetical protein [bacterium]
MDHSHQYEIEARLVEAWRSHRKIHTEATIAVGKRHEPPPKLFLPPIKQA